MSTLDNDTHRELCLALVGSESEEEVITVLTEAGLWSDSSSWRYYGGKESNYSDIGNQQDSPDAAIVEKLVNCGDAMLLAKCAEYGVDPEGPCAPKTVCQAQERFFGIKNGDLNTLSKKNRQLLADKIGMVASGSRSNPCYSFFDLGIGQSPSQFPDTFLSLTASNKIRIHCVQGRFNMGSTGVLEFSGNRNLQLIVSRKHPAARNGLTDGERWGVTIVRREDPHDDMKSSSYQYLAPNGEIITFDAESLRILPGVRYPDNYARSMAYGTYIKVYDYNIGASYRTNILFDLNYRLSFLMPNATLPIRLYERRDGYVGHSMEVNLMGLLSRLANDRKNNLETGYPSSGEITIDDIVLPVSIFAFKAGKKENYAKNEGIVMTINGQTHGALKSDFFKRKSIGLGYLVKDILVVVDCSSIASSRLRELLFMNSRDRLRAGNVKARLESQLEYLISNHSGLKRLQEKRKKQAIEDQIADSKPINKILRSLFNANPMLSKVFRFGEQLTDPFSDVKEGQVQAYQGLKFPTFFTLDKEFPAESPKLCGHNSGCKIRFHTDAENEYFSRSNDPGSLMVTCDDTKINYSVNLWNGVATLFLNTSDTVSIGQRLFLTVEVSDASRHATFNHSIYLIITSEIEETSGGSSSPRKLSRDEKKGESAQTQPSLGIPIPKPVKKENWSQHDFDEHSALRAVYDADSYDFFYNADNLYLKYEQKHCPSGKERLIEMQYQSALALIGVALLKSAENESQSNVEEVLYNATRSISPILLPMIRTLGDLENLE
ncbi:hypothetical protein GT360_17850 [Vibrio astriarenae]|uniref:Uncharacterized protein n=1 Tax=Vibrio astriarenae TaxID=1481923 RepID=A0A7Z2YFP4_9VIBR|nr:hypothetical protein [Vibrio astriarenae]QIA65404.1 hypothetical protein GT360_17850 [Vibrio astriarenae]